MTATATASTLISPAPDTTRSARAHAIDIALLGLGHVGSAVAALALGGAGACGRELRIAGALVRDRERPREHALHRRVPLSTDAAALLAGRPDLVIEVLGGLEPARSIVVEALERGIPVVTANKSLIAAHGDELADASARGGAPLRYEASVLAGVPFLGTFAARPLAARICGVTGIVNGTTNYILTRMARAQHDFEDALADAQRLGLAEPDPANDVDGIDAREKLAVLIRHFARLGVRPAEIETESIREIQAADLRQAGEFGGAIKPVVDADWSTGSVRAFVGPAFVPAGHKLARIDGVENAVCLHRGGARDGACDLFYSGPGAGPAVTATTILDDVAECCGETARRATLPPADRAACESTATAWFVRLSGVSLPRGADIADLLGSFGIWVRRISGVDSTQGRQVGCLLTFPSPRARLDRALAALADASACDTLAIRTLEPGEPS
jgi:homoserine dehydrogenase